MGSLALLQVRIWCPGCPRGWGMIVSVIFWALVIVLLALVVWFFYRILTGGERQRRGPHVGGGPGESP